MGCKSSKKMNKDAEKQKMCKVGLSLGRNDVKVEGNFQIGYLSKTDKKYSAVDGICENSGIWFTYNSRGRRRKLIWMSI